MQKLLPSILLLAAFTFGCKKEGALSGGGMDGVPASFHFIIADSYGKSLFFSTSDDIALTFPENGQLINSGQHYHPFKTMLPGDPVDFICGDTYMANKSQIGIKTFYLTFQGKTDTLGLDIRRVPVTPDNGGNSTPIVTFNGRPVPPTQGTPDFPDYFVLKRR